jgi:hypothetical protein
MLRSAPARRSARSTRSARRKVWLPPGDVHVFSPPDRDRVEPVDGAGQSAGHRRDSVGVTDDALRAAIDLGGDSQRRGGGLGSGVRRPGSTDHRLSGRSWSAARCPWGRWSPTVGSGRRCPVDPGRHGPAGTGPRARSSACRLWPRRDRSHPMGCDRAQPGSRPGGYDRLRHPARGQAAVRCPHPDEHVPVQRLGRTRQPKIVDHRLAAGSGSASSR